MATHRLLRAKLIFNATSGRPEESPQQLVDILTEMQSRQILPEVFIVRPDSQVEAVVRSAIRGAPSWSSWRAVTEPLIASREPWWAALQLSASFHRHAKQCGL